jgi:hypothetical protein
MDEKVLVERLSTAIVKLIQRLLISENGVNSRTSIEGPGNSRIAVAATRNPPDTETVLLTLKGAGLFSPAPRLYVLRGWLTLQSYSAGLDIQLAENFSRFDADKGIYTIVANVTATTLLS